MMETAILLLSVLVLLLAWWLIAAHRVIVEQRGELRNWLDRYRQDQERLRREQERLQPNWEGSRPVNSLWEPSTLYSMIKNVEKTTNDALDEYRDQLRELLDYWGLTFVELPAVPRRKALIRKES